MSKDDKITYEDFVEAVAMLEQSRVPPTTNGEFIYWCPDPDTLKFIRRLEGRFGWLWLLWFRIQRWLGL